jgi:hypothetical protein
LYIEIVGVVTADLLVDFIEQGAALRICDAVLELRAAGR